MNKRIVVLTSGHSRGSNLEAIVRYIRDNSLPVQIAFVLVTSTTAPIIEKCRTWDLPVIFISTKDYELFEEELLQLIRHVSPDLVVLAGFLKKLSAQFISDCPCRLVNIHPALLPKYGGKGMYGLNVHEAVFQAKDAISGVTVHYVNEEYDAGDIINQASVDVSVCTSPADIAQTVLAVEHKIYPATIWQILQEKDNA